MASFSWSDLQKTAEDAGFVTIPKGTYDAVISKASHGKNQNGKDQIKVVFKILTGPFAGKPLPNTFTISPDSAIALGFFFRHMAALGLNGAYFGTNPTMEKVANDLLGKNCRIEVELERWPKDDENAQERSKIKNIMAPSSGGLVPGAPSASPQPMMAQPQPVVQAQAQPVPQPQPAAPKPESEDVVEESVEEPEDTTPEAGVPAPPPLPFGNDEGELPF